ncbi:protein-disulfide reductase DsbD domain-containing protein [Pedobacter frigoris]|uniref:Uncharacterized protein n=1 Tax=Pedobacter frigoris TaxID=2571272 RepID=A0A4V5P2N3_9SPHI|nr:protein-disulfide reductase DsbD domain-containing protein [Pedobacter frigoris]TKC08982.1 hypothetical protein FA047_02485 [Pedobacter frigoris]
MMKKVIITIWFALIIIYTQGQIIKPTIWSFNVRKVKSNVYELHLTATVKVGWAIYSQWTPEGGPEPTSISFDKNTNLLLGGKAKEIGIMKKKHEEVFDVGVHYFENKVEFVQLVKVKNEKGNKVISGKVKYMTCDKEQCINDMVEFSVELK